jgi:predicted enzyme related to lactoylglutathione lyase
MPEDCPPHAQNLGSGMTVYFLVSNIEKESERLHKLGAKTVLEKRNESDNGWFANLTDPEGNRFGIYEANMEKWGKKEEPCS